MLNLPYEPVIFGLPINVHLVLEYLAFFLAFRYYVFLRKRTEDIISKGNRLSIILGAIVGALLGSRIFGYLENPIMPVSVNDWLHLANVKTVMGGLFGGLLGVEAAKKIIREEQSSGDLFTLPLIAGIFIGRIGCFLSGTNEFTYGSETTFWSGMNLGDGLMRHPLALYELIFLTFLFYFLRKKLQKGEHANGYIFQIFMISYFGFRFAMEFLKPNEFFIIGLSSIQWLCVACFIYYRRTFLKLFSYA